MGAVAHRSIFQLSLKLKIPPEAKIAKVLDFIGAP
jgi:hypothetical protein